MKAMKKIIPAFCLLLVSAVLMGTSTFAWFSMNTEVTASNMNVKAKSDQVFLEIKGKGDDAFSREGDAGWDDALELLPVAHETFTANAEGKITATEIEANGVWYYQYSNDPDAYYGGITSATPKNSVVAVDSTTPANVNFSSYVAKAEFEVQLNPTAAAKGTKAYDLYVSYISIHATATGYTKDTGITVIIAGADGYVEFDKTTGSADSKITFSVNNVISNTVTKDSQTITVYIFIDGNNEDVYTNNVENLVGSVKFGLECFVTQHETASSSSADTSSGD